MAKILKVDIIGVIVTDGSLDKGDWVGSPTTAYPARLDLRASS